MRRTRSRRVSRRSLHRTEKVHGKRHELNMETFLDILNSQMEILEKTFFKLKQPQ